VRAAGRAGRPPAGGGGGARRRGPSNDRGDDRGRELLHPGTTGRAEAPPRGGGGGPRGHCEGRGGGGGGGGGRTGPRAETPGWTRRTRRYRRSSSGVRRW